MWGFRSPETNSLVVIWSLGWDSRKHTDHICWESRQGGRNGLSDGPQEVAGQNTVNMTTYEEGIGRMMYVTGALDRERPRDTNSPVVRLLLPSVFGAEVQTQQVRRGVTTSTSRTEG